MNESTYKWLKKACSIFSITFIIFAFGFFAGTTYVRFFNHYRTSGATLPDKDREITVIRDNEKQFESVRSGYEDVKRSITHVGSRIGEIDTNQSKLEQLSHRESELFARLRGSKHSATEKE